MLVFHFNKYEFWAERSTNNQALSSTSLVEQQKSNNKTNWIAERPILDHATMGCTLSKKKPLKGRGADKKFKDQLREASMFAHLPTRNNQQKEVIWTFPSPNPHHWMIIIEKNKLSARREKMQFYVLVFVRTPSAYLQVFPAKWSDFCWTDHNLKSRLKILGCFG